VKSHPKAETLLDMSNHQSSTKLPSRRYACKVCGRKGRRNNAPDERLREPVCPSCEKSLRHFDTIIAHMSLFDIIKRKIRNWKNKWKQNR
jgi:rubrerythrin